MRRVAVVLLPLLFLPACGADSGETPAPMPGPGDDFDPDSEVRDSAPAADTELPDAGPPPEDSPAPDTEPPEDRAPPEDTAPMDVPARDTATPPMDVARDLAPDTARDSSPPRVDSAPPRPDVTDAPRAPDTAPVPVPRPGDVRAGAMCHQLLRDLGVRFTTGPSTRGVEDPVTVTPPIEGVHYRYASWTAAERAMLMDCRLTVALVRLGRQLRSEWGIDDVQHLGIYNYRTIAGSTTLSQHAYATAIDIAALRSTSGTTYSVLTDFAMNGAPTCPPRATGPRDRVLKEVACWMYDSRTFHIILTPNYNSAHRNHFHVDLTTGSHFVRAPELPDGVDPPHDPLLDWLYDDE